MIIGKDQANHWYLVAPRSQMQVSAEQQLTKSIIVKEKQQALFIDLDDALEFDQQLGKESLYFFFCSQTQSFESLKVALQNQEASIANAIPAYCQVSSFHLMKTAHP